MKTKTLKLIQRTLMDLSSADLAAIEATNNRKAVAYLRAVLRQLAVDIAGQVYNGDVDPQITDAWSDYIKDALRATDPHRIRGEGKQGGSR